MIQLIWLIFASFLGQIISILIGYVFLRFLPKSEKFPFLQKIATSYGLGTGLLALSMFLSILIGMHPIFSFYPLLIITIAIAVVFKIPKNFLSDIRDFYNLIKHLRVNKVELFCFFLLFIELIYLFSYWFMYPVFWWDAITYWDGAAKVMFYDGNFSPNTYPVLVPLNYCFYFSLFGQYHYFSKILIVGYFIHLHIFLFYSLRFFKLDRTYSILITTTLALLGFMFVLATTAVADLPLTFFYTIASIFLFYYVSTKKKHYLLYSSVFMGFSVWVKPEGFYLFIINASVFVLYQLYFLVIKKKNLNHAFREFLSFIILGILILLPWRIFYAIEGFENYYTPHLFEVLNYKRVLTRLRVILPRILYRSTSPFRWGLFFWFIFYLILILNIRILFKEDMMVLLLLISLHFLLYIVVYLITPLELKLHIRQSFDRMLLHLTPLCCFLMGILLSNNKKLLVNFKEDSNYIPILKVIIILFICVAIIFSIFYDEIYDSLKAFELFKFFKGHY